MADDQTKDGGVGQPDAGRRKLLKVAAAAGGAVAATTMLPGSWVKPVAKLGVLPAHAQVSNTLQITNLTVGPAVPQAARRGAVGEGFQWAQFDYHDELGKVNNNTELTAEYQEAAVEGAPAITVCGEIVFDAVPLGSIPGLQREGDGFDGTIGFNFFYNCTSPSFQFMVQLGDSARTSNALTDFFTFSNGPF
jgi:hypothetical protein